MRFIDEIRTGRCPFTDNDKPEVQTLLASLSDSTPVILGDSLWPFFQAHWDSLFMEEVGPCLADIWPNAVPPFSSFWVEWTHRRSPSQRVGFADSITDDAHWGVLVTSTRANDSIEMTFQPVYLSLLSTDRSSLLLGSLSVTTNLEGIVSACQFTSTIEQTFGVDTWSDHDPRGSGSKEDFLEELYSNRMLISPYYFAAIPLTAMCFMNCRNVPVTWLPPPDKPYTKSFTKKHGTKPCARLARINITPMTKFISAALISNTDRSRSTRQVIAHICRGHFKTYTPDHPLFGRIVGTYWWDTSARGIKATDTEKPKPKEYAINTKGIVVKTTSPWAKKLSKKDREDL